MYHLDHLYDYVINMCDNLNELIKSLINGTQLSPLNYITQTWQSQYLHSITSLRHNNDESDSITTTTYANQSLNSSGNNNHVVSNNNSQSTTASNNHTISSSTSSNDRRTSSNTSVECGHGVYVNKTNAVAAGVFSGVAVAGIFNPWDRALYLSVVHERPFFALENWKAPYTGFYQVLVHRTLTSGLYFPLFDIFREPSETIVNAAHLTHAYAPNLHGLAVSFLVGNLAGATSGAVLNPLTAIKYSAWDTQHSFLHTCKLMYSSGGTRPFINAIGPTVIRDTIFGGCFSTTKHTVTMYWIKSDDTDNKRKLKDFIASAAGGAAGTILSAPFNFVRNIQFGTPPNEHAASTTQILRDLLRDCKHESSPWNYLQDRLRIGWGTARVAVGMAVGYELYDITKRFLDKQSQSNSAAAQLIQKASTSIAH